MSLLDDARQLASIRQRPFARGTDEYGRPTTPCYGCGGDRKCLPDCPYNALPRIVAVLESAERLSGVTPWVRPGPACFFCGGKFRGDIGDEDTWSIDHEPDCPWQALVAALRGEE